MRDANLLFFEMRDNPNITKIKLQKKLKISGTAVDNNIDFTKKWIHRKN